MDLEGEYREVEEERDEDEVDRVFSPSSSGGGREWRSAEVNK